MVNPTELHPARLVGLDWGSTSLRAMLIDEHGHVLRTRHSTAGVSTLDGNKSTFSAALDALIGDWDCTALPIWACGMVGSQHGWREVPYLSCPATPASLVAAASPVEWRDRRIMIVPGLIHHNERQVPDVMRGEETQVLGALVLEPDAFTEGACIIMPGTHSKWALVRDSMVHRFATHMTGELFAVLRAHSVLGRLMPSNTPEYAVAFNRGVEAARDQGQGGLSHQLFSVRTLGLTGSLNRTALPDYLSGLLIGHELRAGLMWREAAGLALAPLLLVGEPTLCNRYAEALRLMETPSVQILPNTAALGLWKMAQTLHESLQ